MGGGYKSYLREIAKDADIRYHFEVKHIDTLNRIVYFTNGDTIKFDRLISSLPLPLVAQMCNAPSDILKAAQKLECTSGYHISLGLRTKKIPPYLWWYIYDEDILASRVYSPSLKSPDNAPKGCSSLQFEVSCKEGEYTKEELIKGTVGKMVSLGILNKDDILFAHVGFEKYANITFTEPIYDARKIVREWLLQEGVETIGRFGEWDYLWSDQSLMSGIMAGGSHLMDKL